MQKIIILLLCFPLPFYGSFFDEDDPTHCHNVNVISGQLNLTFIDFEIKGPIPFSFIRTYTSAGALERSPKDLDIKIKDLEGSDKFPSGGWGFLNYTRMLSDRNSQKYYAYEKNSSRLIPYAKQGFTNYFIPQIKNHKISGKLSSKLKLQNNKIKVKEYKLSKQDRVILSLPDGTERRYSKDLYEYQQQFLKLAREILPSKHVITYQYNDANQLEKIQLQNPSETKIFASVDLDYSLNKLNVKLPGGKELSYQKNTFFKRRSYLNEAITSYRPKETFHYQGGGKGQGARLTGMSLGHREQFRVAYYFPKVSLHKQEDKVESLLYFDPTQNDFTPFVSFDYKPNKTEVRDYEGNLTRYTHDEEKLQSIEYYDNERTLHTKVAFVWQYDDLLVKKLYDGNLIPQYQKVFTYDDQGNVLTETWEDHASSLPPIHRTFTYTDKLGLVRTDCEEGGLKHHYTYLENTNLVTRILTYYQDRLIKREFFGHNEDNLLIAKVIDDGSHPRHPKDITQKQIQKFDLDPQTGLCKTFHELYLDLETNTEKPIVSHQYTYNEQLEIISETLEYPDGDTYTIHMSYDEFGHLIKLITPLGRENTFKYDDFGNLIEVKEVGSPKKWFSYDRENRPCTCIEADKMTKSHYDRKGRLIAQTDSSQNTLYQKYDSFGRCIETQFPQSLNPDGTTYTPIAKMGYDYHGNLIFCTNPKGETTHTQYNMLRKPTCITYPDGSRLHHAYNKDGTLSKTTHPDQSETQYTHDHLQRMTSKIYYDQDKTELSSEKWVYNTFHLLSYTDSLGLTTYFEYDSLGRKITETAEDRKTIYSYDKYGNIERITCGDMTRVQIHNIEGEVVELWEEDSKGKIENHLTFSYNQEGRKEQAIRLTSQGEALDFFFYDEDGNLCKHIDPHGEITQFVYEKITNTIGQIVDQKITIDPLGNSQIEVYDANNKIASIEKRDPHSQTVAFEQRFYDPAGNYTKRLVTIYENNKPLRTHSTLWEYSSRGLCIKEIEEHEKITTNTYDSKGRLIEKKLPSGITLYQAYDGLNRILSMESSDGNLHYTYVYDKGPFPICATDELHHLTWNRTYNLFGEITSETSPNGAPIHWFYDNQGRKTHLILPDHSSIQYDYHGSHLKAVHRYDPHQKLKYTHAYTEFDENGHVEKEELIYNLGSITSKHDLLERIESVQSPWHKASLEYGPSGLVEKTTNSLFEMKEFSYDPLNQLVKEGNQTHHFDSLGNPLTTIVNHLNQIISTPEFSLTYNENGSPINQKFSNDYLIYKYDPLNRLIALRSQKKFIKYTYDPFSRLYSKDATYTEQSLLGNTQSRIHHYYIYDQNVEIGTYDETGNLKDLKVIGLGLLGEIGGAVALEINNKVYVPLHDFGGNIIALISTEGNLVEKCEIDAFGKDLLTSPSSNPWRFHSKRSEEHLVFFGERFYFPKLGRWLTPDPTGSVESPNLYLYVRNSPLNRLDLFGLESEEYYTRIDIKTYYNRVEDRIPCTAFFGDVEVDMLIYSSQLHKLNFTPEELDNNHFDIFDHFHELTPKEGMCVGLISYQNGIGAQWNDFVKNSDDTYTDVPNGTLFIAVYTPTNGPLNDIRATYKDKKRSIETSEVVMTRQTMTAIVDNLENVNPNLLWLHIPHSRAGTIGCAAIDGMEEGRQIAISRKLLWFGIAPAEPLAKSKALDALNIYSIRDSITGGMGKKFDNLQKDLPQEDKIWDIRFVECLSPRNEWSLYLADHGYLGTTYRTERAKKMKSTAAIHGFNKNTR